MRNRNLLAVGVTCAFEPAVGRSCRLFFLGIIIDNQNLYCEVVRAVDVTNHVARLNLRRNKVSVLVILLALKAAFLLGSQRYLSAVVELVSVNAPLDLLVLVNRLVYLFDNRRVFRV